MLVRSFGEVENILSDINFYIDRITNINEKRNPFDIKRELRLRYRDLMGLSEKPKNKNIIIKEGNQNGNNTRGTDKSLNVVGGVSKSNGIERGYESSELGTSNSDSIIDNIVHKDKSKEFIGIGDDGISNIYIDEVDGNNLKHLNDFYDKEVNKELWSKESFKEDKVEKGISVKLEEKVSNSNEVIERRKKLFGNQFKETKSKREERQKEIEGYADYREYERSNKEVERDQLVTSINKFASFKKKQEEMRIKLEEQQKELENREKELKKKEEEFSNKVNNLTEEPIKKEIDKEHEKRLKELELREQELKRREEEFLLKLQQQEERYRIEEELNKKEIELQKKQQEAEYNRLKLELEKKEKELLRQQNIKDKKVEEKIIQEKDDSKKSEERQIKRERNLENKKGEGNKGVTVENKVKLEESSNKKENQVEKDINSVKREEKRRKMRSLYPDVRSYVKNYMLLKGEGCKLSDLQRYYSEEEIKRAKADHKVFISKGKFMY